MTETPAQAYARAHAAWSQWLRHWNLTGDPRALRTALACKRIAEEKSAAVQSDRGTDWPQVRSEPVGPYFDPRYACTSRAHQPRSAR